MNESCRTYTSVSRPWEPHMNEQTRHVTHMIESCHTHPWVISHLSSRGETCNRIWMSECVMSHIWLSHVTHIHKSCHTFPWVMSNLYRRVETTATTDMNLLFCLAIYMYWQAASACVRARISIWIWMNTCIILWIWIYMYNHMNTSVCTFDCMYMCTHA